MANGMSGRLPGSRWIGLFLAPSLLAAGVLAIGPRAGGRSTSESVPPITDHGEWRQLAPQSSWSIWQPACIVQSILTGDPPSENAATATLSISTIAGADTFIVGVSSELWTDISDGARLSVDFGFDDEPPEEDAVAVNLPVLSHAGAGDAGPGFLTGVDAEFLRRMADSVTMEVYRDGSEAISLDTRDAAKAIELLMACGKVERARIALPVEELYSVEARGVEIADK